MLAATTLKLFVKASLVESKCLIKIWRYLYILYDKTKIKEKLYLKARLKKSRI